MWSPERTEDRTDRTVEVLCGSLLTVRQSPLLAWCSCSGLSSPLGNPLSWPGFPVVAPPYTIPKDWFSPLNEAKETIELGAEQQGKDNETDDAHPGPSNM